MMDIKNLINKAQYTDSEIERDLIVKEIEVLYKTLSGNVPLGTRYW
jgi:hypothetical protein